VPARPADRYDAFLLDLDGVVYRGDLPVPAAPQTARALREAGKRVVFLTNNSARTPEQVAEKLRGMGIQAAPGEVVTSAHATAEWIARQGADGDATAFVIGQDGIRAALGEAGVKVLNGDPQEAAFVVVGWDGDVTYDALRTASVLVSRGARLVATNADTSYPAPGGELWPGAGAILAAVEAASKTTATVIGKPHRPLFDTALDRAGRGDALMVGDRIETDVVGAAQAGLDCALVLTGASGPAELLDHDELPVAVLEDLGELLAERPASAPRGAGAGDMEAVRRLTGAPDRVPAWGPEGVWVIEEGDLLVTATAEVEGADAYLRGVATREDLRGRGLGTLVVAASVGDARRRGARSCFLLTESAEPFFSRLGFERVRRDDVPSWALARSPECPAGAAAMRRDLVQ
jgi:HAD superfamily hydrolase (TIGR01450 family)